jgi:hypothetical protein
MHRAILFALVFILTATTANAIESISLGGSIRTYLTSTKYTSGEELSQAFSMLRLKLSGNMSESMRFELAYEAIPTWKQADNNSTLNFEQKDIAYRVGDTKQVLHPTNLTQNEKFLIFQNLDRAFIEYEAINFDLSVGRQPLSLGSARVINPTDVLAPYTYETLAKEEKPGIDAIRVRIPTGDFSEVDLAIAAGDDAEREKSAAYIRVRSYILETDVTLILMEHSENKMVGIDLARAVGGSSVWIEAAYTYEPKEHATLETLKYTRASIGIDRAFTGNIYAYIEYHFNGAGKTDPDDYILNALRPAYSDGPVYLLGQNYLAPGITFEVTPLLSLQVAAIMNLDDNSQLYAPTLDYSASDNLTASLGAYIAEGDEPGWLTLNSEFGTYPDTYYFSLKYYF